jgi:hypothetical protein
MEATNVFGAGNPSVPINNAVTSTIYGCTATCMRGSIAAATASDPESRSMPKAQRPDRWPAWMTVALQRRGTGTSHRLALQTEHHRACVEGSLRSVAASAQDILWAKRSPLSQRIEPDPAVARRLEHLHVTRSPHSRSWRMHALHRPWLPAPTHQKNA